MKKSFHPSLGILILATGLAFLFSCGGGGGGGGDASATYYFDADNDGYGDPAISQVLDSAQAGWVLDSTDCDDTPVTGASIHPGASETCNGLDDDCDGGTDEDGAGSPLTQLCYTGSPVPTVITDTTFVGISQA